MSIMLQEQQGQDVVMLLQGETRPVTPGPILRSTKWVGGQFVQFVTPIDVNDWLVERSTGVHAAGFLYDASENYQSLRGGGGYRNWTSIQPANREASTLASGAATQTMIADGGRFLFLHFETVALNGAGVRAGGPAIYGLNDVLKVSENGLLCNDPDAFLLLATGGTQVLVVGTCSAVPGARTANRLGLDQAR